jgi:hypothetical protein
MPICVAVLLSRADAVVFAAGAGPGSGVPRKDSVDRGASVLMADAAGRAGVCRFVQISSMGAGQPPRPGTDEVWAAYCLLASPPATGRSPAAAGGHNDVVASYSVNPQAVAYARQLIDARQYVLDSDWGKVQPRPSDQNAFLRSHSWDEYARWHLGLTDGARDHIKARYAFVYGDFRRVHRMGIIACHYRAAEWRHKDIELAAHDLLQYLDTRAP